jgi:type II secretory pathway pseudopilin PulG
MGFDNKKKKFNKNAYLGFSLIELVLVVGLIAIIGSFTAPIILKTYDRQVLISTSEEIFSALKKAQNYSKFRRENSSYGVYFNSASDEYRVFKVDTALLDFDNNDYSDADTDYDETYSLYGISYDFSPDVSSDAIVFGRGSGLPNSTTTITLSINSSSTTRDIVVCEDGIIELGSNCNILDVAELDGSGDYVNIGDVDIPISTDMTLTMWIKADAFNSNATLFSYGGYISDGFVLQTRSDDTGLLRFSWDGSDYYDSDAVVVSDETWVHVGVVVSSGVPTSFYLNGSAVTATRNTGSGTFDINGTEDLEIGRRTDTSSQYFTGRIANVALWRDARTSEEIEADYTRGYPILTDDNIISYWPLAGDYDDDVASSSNDGTAQDNTDFVIDPGRPNSE